MKPTAKILLVDDEPGMLRYIKTLLEVDDYKVETATTGEEALQRIEKGLQPDLVLLDVLMPGIDGLQTLEQLRQKQPGVKVVMLSCVNDTRKVVHAMKLGAQDYLTKPFQKAELDAVIDLSLGQGKQTYSGEVEELADDVFFIAASPAMRKIRSQAALVANVDIPVLLLGESGTGKEVLARLIHKLSPRAHRTFLKVNCAAVPADLLESELFGYEPGAFTGANHAKPGKFELCNKGTILLDEIGEMPPLLQAKLLHVLQDQQFSRLGSRSVIKVDVRILAATNINIPEALANKRLREDLYYRLNAFTLQHSAAARSQRRDSHPAQAFHDAHGRALRTFAIAALAGSAAGLPGPLLARQLARVEQLPEALPDSRRRESRRQRTAVPRMTETAAASGDHSGKRDAGGLKSLARSAKDEAEAQAITQALEQTNWNRKQAAAILQISYKALLYKIRQYGIAEVKAGHHKLSAGAYVVTETLPERKSPRRSPWAFSFCSRL